MLVVQPIGGAFDWHALFHEAGHAEHFANTRAELAVEERRLGDSAVTEGWAMLLEHLIGDPVWLARRLDFPRPAEFASEGAAQLLFFVRRYCAKLLYELEFHSADDLTQMRPRYVELLADALKIEPSPTDYLGDIDSGFYASSYLRSWAFEAQLRTHLREEFGNAWFARGGIASAGALGRGPALAGRGLPPRHHGGDARARVSRGAGSGAPRPRLTRTRAFADCKDANLRLTRVERSD